jgi:hypothetical protein
MPSHMIKEGASLPGSLDADGGGAQLRRVQGAIRAAACLGIAVVLSLTAACSGSSGDIAQPPSTHSAPPSSTSSPDSARAQVLAQYRKFWAVQTPASVAPASKRRAMLSPVAADPELTSLLQGIAKERSMGRVYYGTPVLHPQISSLSESSSVAVVRDCQDASHAGDKDARSGRLLTKGTSRTLVVSTLNRKQDGVWRVAYVTFPKQQC